MWFLWVVLVSGWSGAPKEKMTEGGGYAGRKKHGRALHYPEAGAKKGGGQWCRGGNGVGNGGVLGRVSRCVNGSDLGHGGRFLDGEGPEANYRRNGVFKLIPSVVEGSWIIRQSVGNTPVILGRKLTTHYFKYDAAHVTTTFCLT